MPLQTMPLKPNAHYLEIAKNDPIAAEISQRKFSIASKMSVVKQILTQRYEAEAAAAPRLRRFMQRPSWDCPSKAVYYSIPGSDSNNFVAAWIDAMPRHGHLSRLITQQRSALFGPIGEPENRMIVGHVSEVSTPENPYVSFYDRTIDALGDEQRLILLQDIEQVVDSISEATLQHSST